MTPRPQPGTGPRLVNSAGIDPTEASPQSTGGILAHDQIAQWVRFADTKATILSGALGIVTTLLITQVDSVATQLHEHHGSGRYLLGMLAAITVAAFASALVHLVLAIHPRARHRRTGINRFAWPSLAETPEADVLRHVRGVNPTDELWQQACVLSELAKHKFDALHSAVLAFPVLVVAGAATVATAAIQAV